MSELAHILPPPEATCVSKWYSFEGSCGHQYWMRHFSGRSWTVETSSSDPLEVQLAGCQYSNGPVETWVSLEGTLDLSADEAWMLAATLSRAAEDLERIQGGEL